MPACVQGRQVKGGLGRPKRKQNEKSGHAAASRHGSASAGSGTGRGGPRQPPAAALRRRATPMARSISAPTIAACWSPARPRTASPSSTPSRASSGSARAWRPAARSAEAAMDRARRRARRSAPRNCAAAASRSPARSPPRPAAAPSTAAISSSGCGARPASASRSSRPRRRRGWPCSAATACSSPATGRR